MRSQSVSAAVAGSRSEEHTSELQSPCNLVCRLLLEKKKNTPAKDHRCDALPFALRQPLTPFSPTLSEDAPGVLDFHVDQSLSVAGSLLLAPCFQLY